MSDMNKLTPVEEGLKTKRVEECFIQGICDYCHQKSVRVIQFPCNIHHYCRNCLQYAPKFKKGDLSCTVCDNKYAEHANQQMKKVEVFAYKQMNEEQAGKIKFLQASDLSGNNERLEEELKTKQHDRSTKKPTQQNLHGEVQAKQEMDTFEVPKTARIKGAEPSTSHSHQKKMSTSRPTTFVNTPSLENFLRIQQWAPKTIIVSKSERDFAEDSSEDLKNTIVYDPDKFSWSKHNVIAPPPSLVSSESAASINIWMEDMAESIEGPEMNIDRQEFPSPEIKQQPQKDEFWDN